MINVCIKLKNLNAIKVHKITGIGLIIVFEYFDTFFLQSYL